MIKDTKLSTLGLNNVTVDQDSADREWVKELQIGQGKVMR